MAKSKGSEAPETVVKSDGTVNGQVVDALTTVNPEMLVAMQQESVKGMYQLMEIGMQNTLATHQLMQDSLSLMSDLYKSYFGSINGATQHSWATYSSIWNDPLGLNKEKDSA